MRYDFSIFTSKTGINVVVHDDLRDKDITPERRRDLEHGRNTSWYDRESMTIHIYTGYYSRNPEPNNIFANVIYQTLSFFPPSVILGKGTRGISFPRTDTATGYLMLKDLVEKRSEYLSKLSSMLSSSLGFTDSPQFSEAVRAGIAAAARHAEVKAIEAGDPSYFAEKILSALDNPYDTRPVRIGTVTDPMRAVDFPSGLPVLMDPQNLRRLCQESGMGERDFARSVARGLADPAAVLERDKPSPNGDYQYCVITHVSLPGGVLSMSVPHPRKVVSKIINAGDKGQNACVFATPVTLKPVWMTRMLAHAMENQDKGNPAKGWLKADDKWYGRDYTLIDIIKNETGKSAVTSSAFSAWSLNTIANIQNKFLNPKIPDTNYSPVLAELERRSRIDALFETSKAPGASAAPPTETERRKQRFQTSALSAKAVAVLKEKNALTVEGVIRLGPYELTRLTSPATVKKVERILQELGYSLYNRRSAAREDVFAAMSDEEKDREIVEDFREAMRYAPEGSFKDVSVTAPMHIDGTPFPAAGAVLLTLKSSSMENRWKGSPLFLTAEELSQMSVSPLPTALPTHILTDQGYRTVYNINETTLPDLAPALFEQISATCRKREREVSPYMKILFNSVITRNASSPMARQAYQVLEKFWKERSADFSIRRSRMGTARDGVQAPTERLATEATMYLAGKLRDVGIRVETVDYDTALAAYDGHSGGIEFDSARSVPDDGFSLFRLSGGKIYGYQADDTIYLTEAGINPETPIHEFAHLWAKVFHEVYPSSWESIKDELRSTPLWDSLSRSDDYSYLAGDEDRLAGEVLATMVGEKGGQLMLAASGAVLEEGTEESGRVLATVSHFRQRVSSLAAEKVFNIPGLKNTGALTLSLLQDFADGRFLSPDALSAAMAEHDYGDRSPLSPVTEFSLKNHTDMEHNSHSAVHDTPEHFTLMQLQGARSRVGAILNILSSGSILVFEDVLAIHKEMETEGLLNRFSEATPEGGLFRARSIAELDMHSIYMGRTGGPNSASLWDITMNTDPSVPEEDEKYNTALKQYIHTLTYSLTRTKDVLDVAISEAKEERDAVMAMQNKKGMKGRIENGAYKVYNFIWGEEKTKYPLDPPARMSKYKEDQELVYLESVGITSDALSIVMDGMEYGHEGRMETLVSRPATPVLTKGDIFAPIEATARRVLLSAAGMADENGQIRFANKLPVIYPNGQAFMGTAQSILRLAMETEHLSIPVVLDNELMEQMGIEPSGEPLSLGLGREEGAMVKKDFWFLEQTDFKDRFPQHYEGLVAQFREMNAARTAKASGIVSSFPHLPSLFAYAGKTLNPTQMALFDIALETSLGYCDGVALNVTNDTVQRLSQQDLNELSAQYNAGQDSVGFFIQEAASVDRILHENGKEIYAQRGPDRGFDFESMLKSAENAMDNAQEHEEEQEMEESIPEQEVVDDMAY